MSDDSGFLRTIEDWELIEGAPAPLGATWVESRQAYNFALYSRSATGVTLLLYTEADPATPVHQLQLDPQINKTGRVWGTGMTAKVVWEIVRYAASRAGIEKLAPHDLRRTCARLCRLAGGELDQIQFLLGHVSIQTTERYLRCKQRLRCAVNDRIGIEPDEIRPLQ